MRVYCANTNEIYDSPKAAADALGVDLATVSRVLNGKRPRAGVYLLTYIDNPSADELAALRRWLLYSVYKIVLEEVQE